MIMKCAALVCGVVCQIWEHPKYGLVIVFSSQEIDITDTSIHIHDMDGCDVEGEEELEVRQILLDAMPFNHPEKIANDQ